MGKGINNSISPKSAYFYQISYRRPFVGVLETVDGAVIPFRRQGKRCFVGPCQRVVSINEKGMKRQSEPIARSSSSPISVNPVDRMQAWHTRAIASHSFFIDASPLSHTAFEAVSRIFSGSIDDIFAYIAKKNHAAASVVLYMCFKQ